MNRESSGFICGECQPSKDERIEYTFDEFIYKILNHNIRSVLFDFNGEQKKLDFKVKSEDNGVFLYPEYWQRNLKEVELVKIFEYNGNSRWEERFVPMLAKEFFEKYKPYYEKLYLENGKFWKEYRG